MSLVAESESLIVPAKLESPFPFGGDIWRPLQQKWLIPHSRVWAEEQARLRRVEEKTGLCRKTIKALQNGEYAAPVHTSFSISHALDTYTFLSLLAERVGVVLSRTIRALPNTRPLPKNFLLHVANEYERYFELWDKVSRGEALDESEQPEFDKLSEKLIDEIKSGRERSHVLRQQQKQGDHACTQH